ncbi:MAG: M56 family metallopeptidase [Bacteroidota bacterium]
MTIPESLSVIFQSIGWTLIHSLWQVSLIVAVTGLILTQVDRRRADLRHNVLSVALFACGIAGLGTFVYFFSSFNTHGLEWSGKLLLIAGTEAPVQLSGTVSEGFKFWWPLGVSGYVWIAGVLWISAFTLLCLKYLVSYRMSVRLRTKGLTNIPFLWECKFRELVIQAGISKDIVIQFSRFVNNPVSLGFFKPIILLPLGYFTMLSPAQAEAVILHELAHIRRNDYLWNLMQTVIRLGFFFHPAVWFLYKQIEIERENACDDFALSISGMPTEYAKALGYLKINIFKSQNPLAMYLINNENELLSRLKRLVGDNGYVNRNQWNNSKLLAPILLFAACFFFMAFDALRPDSKLPIPVTENSTEFMFAPMVVDTIVPIEEATESTPAEQELKEHLKQVEKEMAMEKKMAEKAAKAAAKELEKAKLAEKAAKEEKAKAEKAKTKAEKAKAKAKAKRLSESEEGAVPAPHPTPHHLSEHEHHHDHHHDHVDHGDHEDHSDAWEEHYRESLKNLEQEKARYRKQIERAEKEYEIAMEQRRISSDEHRFRLAEERERFERQNKEARAAYREQLAAMQEKRKLEMEHVQAQRKHELAQVQQERKLMLERIRLAEHSQMRNFKSTMLNALVSDKLISSSKDRVFLEFDNDILKVNGKQLNNRLKEKYLDLIAEHQLDLGSEWSIEMTPTNFSKNSNN